MPAAAHRTVGWHLCAKPHFVSPDHSQVAYTSGMYGIADGFVGFMVSHVNCEVVGNLKPRWESKFKY